MQAVAKAKMIRVSPRKIGLVAALIRGKTALEAQVILANTNKSAAEIVGKVLDAAIANAENNQNLKARDLVIESVLVGAGATLKRMRPRARGQAGRIMKRTSHITIILSDQSAKAEAAKPVEAKVADTKEAPKTEAKATVVKPATKKPATKKEAK